MLMEAGLYPFKVSLKEIQPPIWRRFQVRSDITFRELHKTLQVVMGWWNSHLHLFQVGLLLITDTETLVERQMYSLRRRCRPPD